MGGYFEKLKAFSFVFLFRLIIKSLKMSAFDMGAAKAPSALIKTTRWSLLLVGIWYGHKRYNELKIQEDEIKANLGRRKGREGGESKQGKYATTCKGGRSEGSGGLLIQPVMFSNA